VLLHAFLISALDGDEWSASRPGRLTPDVSVLISAMKPVIQDGQSPDRESNPGLPNMKIFKWLLNLLFSLI